MLNSSAQATVRPTFIEKRVSNCKQIWIIHSNCILMKFHIFILINIFIY